MDTFELMYEDLTSGLEQLYWEAYEWMSDLLYEWWLSEEHNKLVKD